jgi:hypothetical protein
VRPARLRRHASSCHAARGISFACGATSSTPAGQIVQPWAESAAHCWLAQCLHRYSSPCCSTRYAARTAGPHRSHASFMPASASLAESRRSRRYAQPHRHRYRDLVPAPRQRDRAAQPAGPCPDDYPHAVTLFRPAQAIATPSATPGKRPRPESGARWRHRRGRTWQAPQATDKTPRAPRHSRRSIIQSRQRAA